MKQQPECRLEVTDNGGASGKFILTGVMNFQSIPLLDQQAGQYFPKYKSIVIDLSGVTYVNSAGLALLLEWKRKAVLENKTIQILSIPQKLVNIARVSEIEDILSLH
jgi:phospholipid transport system transporter-binding protein